MAKRRPIPQRDLLATLGPPSPAARSPWHAARRTTLSPEELAAHLEREIRGCVASRSSPSERTLVAGTAGGHDVWVTLRVGEARIEALPVPETAEDEEHGGTTESSTEREEVDELAARIAESVQSATGWYLRSERLFDFEPSGACESCGTELFAWQDECPRCHAPVEDASERSIPQRVAEATITMLVEDGLLAVGSAEGRVRLVRRLTSALDKRLDLEPERFFGIVSAHADVSACALDVELLSRRVESARDVVRCPPPKERTRLATLREPTASEASPWHRPRAAKPLFELVAALQKNGGARCLGADEARATLVHGPVFVTLDPCSATLDVRSVDSHRFRAKRASWERDDAAIELVAEQAGWIVERLQLATGWYVSSEWVSDCEPRAACAKCGAELFAWQEQCACEPPFHVVLGDRLCDLLLSEELLELESPAARGRVASVLGDLCEQPEPARILDALVGLEGVSEVFADAADIARLLQRADDDLS